VLEQNNAAARRGARLADPEVTAILAESEWRAHHLINRAIIGAGHPVLRAAMRAGWQADGPDNMVALPATLSAQAKLPAHLQRAIHDSGHPGWNSKVKAVLDRIEESLDDDYGKPDSPSKDRAAFDAVRELQQDLRKGALNKRRLTMQEGLMSPQNA
jgi:hypothetical protein